jgi:hypothetical protein
MPITTATFAATTLAYREAMQRLQQGRNWKKKLPERIMRKR